MSHYNEVFSQNEEEHTYRTFEPKELEEWLSVLAEEYIALRTSTEAEITPISVNGLGLFDTKDLEDLLKSSVIPEPKTGAFSITRSDLSEVASYLILEDEYQTQIGLKLVRDRELIDSPGRGIDVVGIENEESLNLVLTEVKFSDEAKAPPQVVQSGKDCLQKQHQAHLENQQATFSKLMDCSRKVRDSHLRNLYLAAALLFREQKWDALSLTYCSVLVRPENKYNENDFGCFITDPDSFSPGKIRFLILRLPGEMSQILDSWHEAIADKSKASPEAKT